MIDPILAPLEKEALQLDAADPIATLRDAFAIPDGVTYLDGNSLGALPKSVPEHLDNVVRAQWGADLIRSWNTHQWIDLPQLTARKLAPLLGVESHQVTVCDSISINLFKALSIALAHQTERSLVLSNTQNFPTDLYIAQGLEHLLGEQRCQLKTVDTHAIESALSDEVAVLMLTQVDFRTGELLDIERLTRLAHEVGAVVIWDLAHSTGVIPLELNQWNVDIAVGCGYKYLNGGPGAPAFIALNEALLTAPNQPIWGWMGHAAPFAFNADYEPAANSRQMLTGTPGILSLAALNAALDVFNGVDMYAVREKSVRLSSLFIQGVALLDSHLEGVTLPYSFEPEQRGSHVALRHPDAYAVTQALIARHVIIDFRAPDLMRFGFAPLYNRYYDVVIALDALLSIITSKTYQHPEYHQRATVT